ncbi:MAG: hypothetical protein HY646_20185 [Acidobacteria bacterium]|nr:hypothetical protein [Acidobacteriota bacterium]
MALYTITVQIDEVGDELEISILGEAVAGGALPAGLDNQRARRDRGGAKNRVKNEKKARHNHNHRHPDVIGPHLPLFLMKHPGPHDDEVIFQCAQPFIVDVSLDPGFDPPAAGGPAPQNPFGWLIPQTGDATHPVTGTIVKASFPGGARLDFYKLTIWSNGKKLDPDVICESL